MTTDTLSQMTRAIYDELFVRGLVSAGLDVVGPCIAGAIADVEGGVVDLPSWRTPSTVPRTTDRPTRSIICLACAANQYQPTRYPSAHAWADGVARCPACDSEDIQLAVAVEYAKG